jgi:hypothetical protein
MNNPVLTDTISLPTVSELIINKPDLQSEFSESFYEKLNLPQYSLGSQISIRADGRELTLKLSTQYAKEIVRPFAYFVNEEGKLVILSFATNGNMKGLLTIVEGQEESMFNGVISQIVKLNKHPEFIKFINFSEHASLNTDHRSEEHKKIDGAKEFELKVEYLNYKFYGKLLKSEEDVDVYKVYIGPITMQYTHNKKTDSLSIDLPF